MLFITVCVKKNQKKKCVRLPSCLNITIIIVLRFYGLYYKLCNSFRVLIFEI